jgi:hypothetical protein
MQILLSSGEELLSDKIVDIFFVAESKLDATFNPTNSQMYVTLDLVEIRDASSFILYLFFTIGTHQTLVYPPLPILIIGTPQTLLYPHLTILIIGTPQTLLYSPLPILITGTPQTLLYPPLPILIIGTPQTLLYPSLPILIIGT